MMNEGGSLLTLTYGGSTRVVPCYNVMGVAKAALEASRALSGLRSRAAGYPRERAVRRARCGRWPAPAFPMRAPCCTTSSSHAPMRRSPTLDEVGGAALYLLSDLSGAVTGEVHFVDCGYSTTFMPDLIRLKEHRAVRGSSETRWPRPRSEKPRSRPLEA